MKKSEIIHKLAFLGVPDNATLKQVDLSGGVGTISSFSAGEQSGGMNIILAQMAEDIMSNNANDLPHDPCPELFAGLHRVLRDHFQGTLDGMTVEGLEAGVLEDYRKAVQELQEIAGKLSIIYDVPQIDDPAW